MDLSLVIPTYNEKENISSLIEKIEDEFKQNRIRGEIIIVDDNSPDGTGEIVDALIKKRKNLRVVHRSGKLGLSSAVLEGWKISYGNILGVMDADLSHPVEKIKELFFAIKKDDIDFSIGSRYVSGGAIKNWGIKRKLMSRAATLMAKFYTNIKDPMSGFFMIKKDVIKRANLNPKGFKILLEVLIKGKYKSAKEIPITFVDRTMGKSKANTKEIIYYIQNLFGYLSYKKKAFGEFLKFGAVGGVGTFINLAILYLLTEMFGVYYIVSAIVSFSVAMSGNFILNKIWTFKEDIKSEIGKKYLQFGLVSICALLVNLFFLYLFTDVFGIYYLVSQVLAIVISMIINFLGNKKWTFGK